MKLLRESLVLTDARAVNLMRVPIKGGYTSVLIVKGPLTPAIADTLRCRNQIYDLNDSPYPALKSLSLDHEFGNCEFSVPSQPILQPSVVAGFRIVPSELAEADGELELHFRMKFSGKAKELNALMDRYKETTFDLSLISLQGSLFSGPVSKGDGPAGGTKVDMTGGSTDNAFSDILPTNAEELSGSDFGEDDEDDEDPPPLVAAVMTNGIAEVDKAISAGTLPTAREMAGGTTADAKRASRKRTG